MESFDEFSFKSEFGVKIEFHNNNKNEERTF